MTPIETTTRTASSSGLSPNPVKNMEISSFTYHHRGNGRLARAALIVGLFALTASLAFASTAGAATPEFLFRAPADGARGGGAGMFSLPRDVVGDPSTGRLYVSDLDNSRISEYTAWGLFVKSWGWGVSNGAAEFQTCGPAEPESEPEASLCSKGISGSGKGQFNNPDGITLDAAGNVFVVDLSNFRVQKFSSAGEFLLMFGGKVNQTKVAEGAPTGEQNVCPIAPSDVCQAGTPGSASSHFTPPPVVGNYIDYSPTANAILVGDKDRIQVFNLDGSLREEIPFEGELEAFDEEWVRGLEVDFAGNIYITLVDREDVYKLSPSGEPLDPGKPGSSKFDVEDPKGAVAVDGSGNVYAVDDEVGFIESRVIAFDTAGNKLFPTQAEEEAKEFFPYIAFQGPTLTGLTTNGCAGDGNGEDLYLTAFGELAFGELAYLETYGPPPIACEPPPAVPPEISQQYAAIVKSESATLKAQINPFFWDDTTYSLEYGTGECSKGGCPSSVAAAQLTSKVVNKAVTSGGVFLAGLQPGTTYHYRFIAQSGGGGPVFGIDPDGGGEGTASPTDGLEGTFRTFSPASGSQTCGNAEFRGGVGEKLPDCRAYELVSPLDKSNGDAALMPPTKAFHQLNQSSISGGRFTYSSFTPFAEPESAPYVSQYLASRDPGIGWVSESIAPPRSTRPQMLQLSLNNEFKAFSADLCSSWLRYNSKSPLSEEAIPGFPNLYRRDNCSEPVGYEALSTAEPLNRAAEDFWVFPVGFTEDGRETIFLANGALTEDAPPLSESELQLYVHGPKGLRFLCRLPNGKPYGFACAAGMVAGQPDGKASALHNAISADGSRVFWTAYKAGLANAPEGIPGKVYVRLNPEEEQSEAEGSECTEPEKACTLRVSESVSPEPAEYWGASDDGSKAIFKIANQPGKDFPQENNLYEFDVETRTARLIAGGVEGPMGMSDDASRIYFSASKVLGEGASEGAKEGAHNLYFYEAPEAEGGEGHLSFIMALADSDFVNSEVEPGPIEEVPTQRSAAVASDGLHATFTSAVSPTPTGYDNRDVASGKPDSEVYRYESATGGLQCVSCNPTNARPLGDPGIGVRGLAARLPNVRAPLTLPRPLSEDGQRLFFESQEALVPHDNNGTWDVYQWEAPGTGGCDTGDATFGQAAQGCVDLISSGESAAPSTLLDADPSGTNVFIGTQGSLIATDPGSNDVYDARIGGGFPLPIGKSACEGGACQNPASPPAALTPASAAFEGKGNVPGGRNKRCRRGSHKVRRGGKSRCVPKHKRRSKQSNKRRRATK